VNFEILTLCSEDSLACAKSLYSLAKDQLSRQKPVPGLQQKTRMNLLVSDACLLYSMLAMERGAASLAITHAKQCVRLLRRSWANTEEDMRLKTFLPDSSCQKTTEKLAEEPSQLNLSTSNNNVDVSIAQTSSGSTFWNLVAPLFHGLKYLSQLYAHHGMFQETLYYAQQAYKLSTEVGSETHLAMGAAHLGVTWLKSGNLDKGSEFLMVAQQVLTPYEHNRDSAVRMYHLGSMHGLLGDRDAEIIAYDRAQDVLQSLTKATYIALLDKFPDQSNDLHEQMSKLTVSERKAPAARKAVGRTKAAGAKRKTVAQAHSSIEEATSVAEACPQLISLKAMILRDKARALISNNKFAEALAFLDEAETFANTQIDIVDQGLARAKHLLLHSMEQMNADPVYSVLQDSTISFPSVVGPLKAEKHGDRLSITKVSSPRRAPMLRNNRDRAGLKSPALDSFFDKLRQAQEHLTELHSIAIAVAPVAVIHEVSAVLNSVAILLSAAGQVKGKILANPGFASCSIGMFNLDACYFQTKISRNGTNDCKTSRI
jgi:separase